MVRLIGGVFELKFNIFMGLIWPLNGPTQKGQGTNMGAGSLAGPSSSTSQTES
jgi:hypothetical protein